MDNKDNLGTLGYLSLLPPPLQYANYQIPLQMELDEPGLCAALAAKGYKVTLYPHLPDKPEVQVDLRQPN